MGALVPPIIAAVLGFLLGVILTRRRPVKINGGFKIMFKVKADNPDVPYKITAPTITDSEGNPLPPSAITYDVTSTNEAAVSLVPDSDDDPTTGVVHFGKPNDDGTPGLASVEVAVKANGVPVGGFGAQFMVTTGDPAKAVGGGIAFTGLTEEPVEPAPPAPGDGQ